MDTLKYKGFLITKDYGGRYGQVYLFGPGHPDRRFFYAKEDEEMEGVVDRAKSYIDEFVANQEAGKRRRILRYEKV